MLPRQLLRWATADAEYTRLPTQGDETATESRSGWGAHWVLAWEWWRLQTLLPSFLHRGPKSGQAGEDRATSSTAWLDGLRGTAALLVVFHHASLLFFSWTIHHPFTSWSTGYFIQLPIIRLVVSGLPQVAIFFVVSGYSISLKTLRHLHNGNHPAASNSLFSIICRRHSRLFIPAAVVSFISALWSHWGWFPPQPWHGVVAIGTRAPPRDAESLWRQLMDWLKHLLKHMDPVFHTVNAIDGFAYDSNQWTLPAEFAGSMVVFVLLAAMSRFRPAARLAATFAVLVWSLNVTSYAVFLFVGGMFLADFNLLLATDSKSVIVDQEDSAADKEFTISDSDELPLSQPRPGRSAAKRLLRHALSISVFLLALYLLSMPELQGYAGPLDPAPGYKTLASLIPVRYWEAGRPDYFFIPLGAFFLVGAIDRSPNILQRVFTTRFALYLGRISFMLYLVHGPVLYTFAVRLCPPAMEAVGGGVTDTQWAGGVALVAMAFGVVVLWYADVMSRWVDERAVRWVRKAYELLTLK